MNQKKTNEEFLIELKETNPNYISLESYINNHTKILCKCLIHKVDFYSTPKRLLQGRKSCPKCIAEMKRSNYIKSNEQFLQELKEKNIDVFPLEEYKGDNTLILFRCSCGENWKTTPRRVLIGNHCKKCGYSNFVGEKNHFYNPNITDSDRKDSQYRYRNPEYGSFVEKCFERDNYTCRITGKKSTGNILVHHLNGFNWDKNNRTNVDNGITLNINIHKEFHCLYGKGNNTKEQFMEFADMLFLDGRISKERYNSIKNQICKIK